MDYFNVLLLFIALFLLTCLLCWVSIVLVMVSPLYSIGLFLVGILSVVMMLDMIKSKISP